MVSFLNLSMFKVKPTHDRLLLSMLGKGAYCDTVSGPSREEAPKPTDHKESKLNFSDLKAGQLKMHPLHSLELQLQAQTKGVLAGPLINGKFFSLACVSSEM